MNKKRIIILIVIILAVILGLWISGIIPKQIARISATYQFKKYYPKTQMKYENIEWASSFGSYIIQFKNEDNKLYGFCVGPKYFPINLGQGIDGFEEEYREKYENQDTNNKEEYAFYGKIIEANSNYIIVEPNEGENIRKSSDKISINLGKDNDMIYQVGTNVKITYTGEVMESYPAQIKATNIEIKSVDNFELKVNNFVELIDNKPYKILSEEENKNYNYDIYAYKVNVEIEINGESLNLRKALLENKITMDEIIVKANNDLSEGKITGDMYKDGGSMIYKYDNYTIIKKHTVDGNRDVYIGSPDMNYKETENIIF